MERQPPQACDARRSSQSSSGRAFQDTSEVDEDVRGRTEEEVKEGKASGLYTEQEVSFGRRREGSAWCSRPASGPSTTSASSATPAPPRRTRGSTGQRWTCAPASGSTAGKGDEWVVVDMRNGQVYKSRLHASVKEQAAKRIVGRTVDLRRTFEQFVPAPSMAPLVVIGLWHPRHGDFRNYMLRALPFGARNAVFTFGATARVLEHILVRLFYAVTAQYRLLRPVRVGRRSSGRTSWSRCWFCWYGRGKQMYSLFFESLKRGSLVIKAFSVSRHITNIFFRSMISGD